RLVDLPPRMQDRVASIAKFGAFQRVLRWSDLYAGVAVLRENGALRGDGLPVPLPEIGRDTWLVDWSRVLLRRTFGCWHGQCECAGQCGRCEQRHWSEQSAAG